MYGKGASIVTEHAPWSADFKLEPGSVIAVQVGDRLLKQRIAEVSTVDEPIVPRSPMPPWWRPFSRRKWRNAPVGPTMPVTRLRTEDPFWETVRQLVSDD